MMKSTTTTRKTFFLFLVIGILAATVSTIVEASHVRGLVRRGNNNNGMIATNGVDNHRRLLKSKIPVKTDKSDKTKKSDKTGKSDKTEKDKKLPSKSTSSEKIGDSNNGPSFPILLGILLSILLILFMVLGCWRIQKKRNRDSLQQFDANEQEKANHNINTNNNNHSNNDKTDIDTDIDTDIESPNPSPPSPPPSSTTTPSLSPSPSTVESESKASKKASIKNPSVEPRIYSVEGIPIDEVNDDNTNNIRKDSSIYIEEKQQQPIPVVIAEEIPPAATAPHQSFNSTSTPTSTPTSTSTPAPTPTPTTSVKATTNDAVDSFTKTIGGWFGGGGSKKQQQPDVKATVY